MLKKSITAIIGTSALLLATASIAGHSEMPVPPVSDQGFYVGANFGHGTVDEEVSNVSGSTDNNGFAYNFNAGYQFNPYVALELGYTRFPDVSVGSLDVSDENQSMDIAAKGLLPLGSRQLVDLYGKLGIASVSTNNASYIYNEDGQNISGKQTDILPYLGLGIDFKVARNVKLNLEWAGTPQSDSGDVPEMYGVFLGASYTFAGL